MGITTEQFQEMKRRTDKARGLLRDLQLSEPQAAPVADLTIRPSTDEDRLNKTEKLYLAYLRVFNYSYLGIQNITLKLADDTRYTCDFNYTNENGRLVFDEVKGGFFRDDAKVKIKVVARMYRIFRFRVVRKTKTGWDFEDVKP